MKLTINFISESEDTEVVCKMLLFNEDNKILLLKRSNYNRKHVGEWDFPGGHAKNGEDPEGAVVRECFEETKIKPEAVKKLFRLSNHHIFFGTSGDEVPSISHEHVSFMFRDPTEVLKKRILTTRYEKILKKYLEEQE